jgi:hypothetical protein
MPKPRKIAGSQTLFSISPWQSKSEKLEDAANTGDVDYSVVHEDLVKKPTNAKEPPSADLNQQQPDDHVITNQSPLTDGGWRTKIVKQIDEDVPMLDATQDLLQEGPTIEANAAPLKEEEKQKLTTATATATSPSTVCSLAGTAFLVLLGGSRIVGNFTLLDKTYPLHGKEITSYRECTRDPEWSVVKLHLLNLPYRDLPRELVIIAERTGGDAMKLRSPVEWQGDEVEAFAQELLQGQQVESDDDDGFGDGNSLIEKLEMEFDCHSLLTDAAADEELAKCMPGAVGMDAMINIGPMKLTWKKKERLL